MRAGLNGDGFATAWNTGQGMSQEEAVRYALTLDEVETGTPADAPAAGLTRRELDVLRLLAEGRSNQEIAAELFISPHTVTSHVAGIMNKLGVESRTAAATWAVRHGIA